MAKWLDEKCEYVAFCPVLGGDKPSPGFSDFEVDTVRDYCPTEMPYLHAQHSCQLRKINPTFPKRGTS